MTAKPEFASHNVLLPDGTRTNPDLPPIEEYGVLRSALRLLDETFPVGSVTGSAFTVADLGSLEGGYAAEFAKAGYSVTGIEGRLENHENAVWLRDRLGLPNLKFVCGDVRSELAEVEAKRCKFDAVFCSGLLYHLDKPVAFLRQVSRVTNKLLILNTHVSLEGGHPETAHHIGSSCTYGEYENEGYEGHWYEESTSRWDSVGNLKSFWLKEKALRAALAEAGFSNVTEIHDWRESSFNKHVPGGAGIYDDRKMFVAVK